MPEGAVMRAAILLVTVTGDDGRLKPARLSSAGLRAPAKHLLGANATYAERLALNGWNGFRDVGDYTARIAARDDARLRAIAKGLADRVIDDGNLADRDAAALALSMIAVRSRQPRWAARLRAGAMPDGRWSQP